MKTTLDFLDAVKAKHDLKSDYQLSKHLGCTHSAISNYRMKKNFLEESIACKIAVDLGLDSSYVLACIASERAKKPEVKAAWAHAAEVLYGLAAALVVISILPTAQLPTGEFNTAFMGFTYPAMYIMLNQSLQTFALYSALCLLAVAFIMKRHHYQAKQ